MKIVIISQNVKLQSMNKLIPVLNNVPIVLLSTQKLFKFEKEIVGSFLNVKAYITFSDMLTDKDMEWCDTQAFQHFTCIKRPLRDLMDYYARIKYLKNKLVLERIIEKYGEVEGYICSDDLGLEKSVWLKNGYKSFTVDYYYVSPKNVCIKIGKVLKPTIKTIFKKVVPSRIRRLIPINRNQTSEVYISHWNGKKYVFIGSLNKTGYRMQMKWVKSEEEYLKLKKEKYESADTCHYLSSLHEWTKCTIPDDPRYDVTYIQDGYLPPNYSSLYLRFVPKNVKYYAWDSVGIKIFKNQGVPVSIMPFRKKLYLPKPRFGKKIKKILVVTSGAGDWTAVKNRSDEDLMVEAFEEIAKAFPSIEFVYRCHPVWIHPAHQGVNAINRVSKFFEYTKLSNIKTSSNIIKEDLNDFKLSLPRQSMEADLEGTDLVVGEHSIAMVDGAFKGIPFVSLNLTGRRNLFCGMSDLGFPHFESTGDLINFISHLPYDKTLQGEYEKAVEAYNMMTDED